LDQLYQDLASGQLPNYAHIVPNQCNDMHGLRGRNVPSVNHYSLLRTTEEAFGIDEHLGHANDSAAGVESMTRLFHVQ
jgi:hypothetical protein